MGSLLTRQQDDEFLSADPGDEFLIPERPADQIRTVFDRLVAGSVPIRIVDVLEVVDVEQHGSCVLQRVAMLADIGQGLDAPTVVEAGQRVA